MQSHNKNSIDLLETEETNTLQQHMRSALRLDFALRASDRDYCNNLFAPHRVLSGQGVGTDHPIQAVYQRWAQRANHGFMKNHHPVIDIGGNPLHALPVVSVIDRNYHLCSLPDARDSARLTAAAASVKMRSYHNREFITAANRLAHGMRSDYCCPDGFENCGVYAPFAVANMVHDLSLADLAKGMNNHRTHTVQMFMILPPEALSVPKWTNTEHRYFYETRWERTNDDHKTKRNMKALFPFNNNAKLTAEQLLAKKQKYSGSKPDAITDSLWKNNQYAFSDSNGTYRKRITVGFVGEEGDLSFQYDHDYQTVMSYLTVGGFETPYGFNILIEKRKHWGPLFQIVITRTSNAGAIRYMIPPGCSNIVMVPDLYKMAQRQFHDCDSISYIYADAQKTRDLYLYGTSRDARYKSFEGLKAYARGEMRSLLFNNQVIEKQWNMTIDEFDRFCATIWVMIRLYDKRTYHFISKCNEQVDSLGNEGFFTDFFIKISEMFHNLLDHEGAKGTHKNRDVLLEGKSKKQIANCYFQFMSEIQICNSFEETGEFEEFDFTLLPVFDEEEGLNITTPKVESINSNPTASAPYLEDPIWNQIGIHPIAPKGEREKAFELYKATDHHGALLTEMRQNIPKLPDGGLKKVVQSAFDVIEKMPTPDLCLDRTVILEGWPGAGKTNRITTLILPKIEMINPEAKILIVVPTSELASEYRTSTSRYASVIVKTIHMAISSADQNDYDYIIVDEAFTQPISLLNLYDNQKKTAKRIWVGDRNQIGHIDFTGCNIWYGSVPLSVFADYYPTEQLKISFRCPQDVVSLPLMQKFYPGMSTKSIKRDSIRCHAGNAEPLGQLVAFTNNVADAYSSMHAGKNGEGPRVTTVHRVQGKTFSTVTLIYSGSHAEKELIKKSPAHLIVGLTRHTNNLIIHNLDPKEPLASLMSADFQIQKAADDVGFEPLANEPAEKFSLKTPVVSEIPYQPVLSCTDLVMTTLQKIYPGAPMPEFQRVVTNQIVHQGGPCTGVIRPENLMDDVTESKNKNLVYKFVDSQRVKITKSTDNRAALNGAIKRMSSKVKNDGLFKFQSASRAYKIVHENFDIKEDHQLRDSCFIDLLSKMESRGTRSEDIIDFSNLRKQGVKKITSFLKSQQKPQLSGNVLEKDKVGQPITAHSKTLNLLFGTYCRVLGAQLTNNSKGSCFFVNGRSDKEILSLLETYCKGPEYFEADWTSMDTAHNDMILEVYTRLLKSVGCPGWIIQEIANISEKRTISDALYSITHEYKQDSGAAWTIDKNTLLNIVVMLQLVKGDRMKCFFKGDDLLVNGWNLSYNESKARYFKQANNFILKPKASLSGEFVSFLVNKNGASVNYPRLAAKILSRDYTDKCDYLNYQKAVEPMIRDLTIENVIKFSRVNETHHRINHEKIENIISWIKLFCNSEIKFEALTRTLSIQKTYDLTQGVSNVINV